MPLGLAPGQQILPQGLDTFANKSETSRYTSNAKLERELTRNFDMNVRNLVQSLELEEMSYFSYCLYIFYFGNIHT